MAMTAGSNAGGSYSEINMTPLIDVMLVLLIIFIITLPGQTHVIKIDNPLPHQHGSHEIAAAGSAYQGGQVRELSNGGADSGRFAAARLAKNRLRQ